MAYEATGITEYRLLDPVRHEVCVHERGHERQAAVLPGFQLTPAWLWRAPLPSSVELRRETTGG